MPLLCRVLAGCQTMTSQLRVHAANSLAANSHAIEQVVESFWASLINKDKATYMRLFFSDKPRDIDWQFVPEDTRLDQIKTAGEGGGSRCPRHMCR